MPDMQGFTEPPRKTTPEEYQRITANRFEEHVSLIQHLDGETLERARWMAWIEGPIGRIHRLGRLAELNAKENRK